MSAQGLPDDDVHDHDPSRVERLAGRGIGAAEGGVRGLFERAMSFGEGQAAAMTGFNSLLCLQAVAYAYAVVCAWDRLRRR